MPDDATAVAGQEPAAAEGQEPTGDAETQNVTAGTQDDKEQQTFDRKYVETLRSEAAARRQEAKEAKQALDALKQAQADAEEQAKTANLSELQKLQRQHEKVAGERDTYEAQLQEAYATIAYMTEQNQVRDALAAANVKPERLAQAMKHVDFDSLELEEDGSIKGVEEAIAAVQNEVPEWFGAPAKSVGAGGTNPGNEPQQQKSVADMTDEEIQELSQRAAWGQRVTL